MADVALFDRFGHNLRQGLTECNLSRRKQKKDESDRQMKSPNKNKSCGGVTKAKHFSPFKQPFVYETLLVTAIRRSPTRALTVAEIHAYIADIYPYFKTCPGRLKANIVKTLSTSTCFEKLGSPCEHYWTLTSKAKTSSRVTEEKKDKVACSENFSYTPPVGCTPSSDALTERIMALEAERSYEQNSHLFRAHSQASRFKLPSFSQHSAMYTHTLVSHWPSAVPTISTNSQPTPPKTFSTTIHRDIPDSPLYHRVPVITPGRQIQREELGIKIGEVFSLNPQSSRALSREMLPCPQVKEPYRTDLCFIPYHPCTFRTSHPSTNSPILSSFVSEDKERYEDA